MSLKPDLEDILHRLLNEIPDNPRPASYHSTNAGLTNLKAEEIRYLCETTSALFLKEPTLLRLKVPIQICGKICGHFDALHRLFDRGGHPPIANYLFLGGYVNRGPYSLETLCLLLTYKILYPDQFFMLRGSHETELKATIRGLKSECEARSLMEIWPDLLKLFDCLPLAAIVSDRIFCCYGGPPAYIDRLDEITSIIRPLKAPNTESGIAADLLYSKTNMKDPGWVPTERGHLYGKDAVTTFVDKFDLRTICRARQMVLDGYGLFNDSAELITLISAPNYCGRLPNDGAAMQVSSNLTVTFLIMESDDSIQLDGIPINSTQSPNSLSPYKETQKITQDLRNQSLVNS